MRHFRRSLTETQQKSAYAANWPISPSGLITNGRGRRETKDAKMKQTTIYSDIYAHTSTKIVQRHRMFRVACARRQQKFISWHFMGILLSHNNIIVFFFFLFISFVHFGGSYEDFRNWYAESFGHICKLR